MIVTFSKLLIISLFLTLLIYSGNMALQEKAFAQDSEIPDWIRNVATWWGDGQTSDDDFLNAIKYLIEQKILVIDEAFLPSLDKVPIFHSVSSISIIYGDFNGDGFTDLAIGVPDENIGGSEGAGMVNIIYGSSTGLSIDISPQSWNQGPFGETGNIEANDHFGASLTAGDFNGDGFTDLAIGVPDENIGGSEGAGMVNIIYGSSTGLSADISPQSW